MLPTISTGNVASALVGEYNVANSVRFNDGDSAYMHKTPGGDGNQRTFTFSCWIKLGDLSGAHRTIFSVGADNNNTIRMLVRSNDKFQAYCAISGSDVIDYQTNRLLRDVSAWMHLCLAVDTTQGTAGDRVKIYINGTQETSFSTTDQPDQNTDLPFSTNQMEIGRRHDNTSQFFDGYMAEVVFIDGLALAPTSFGEFDEDSPTIWKPKDVSGLTFGTNGFYLDFEDSSNLGNDVNGGTDLTEINLAATDQSLDTCTNNFATIINASSASKAYTLSEGNLKVTASASNWYGVPRGSIGVSSGKWYYEVKVTDENNNFIAGYMSASNLADVGDRQANGFEKLNGFQSSGYVKRQDSTEVDISGSFQWNDGDIAQIALDMDNKKLWIGKAGSYYNSGNPASGSNETIGSSYFTAGESYLPAFTCNGTNDASFNFGSPPYSESGGNSDANGYGNFNQAVPSGYYSLNTKNLAEFG